jgi:hypothetical protein
MDRVVVLGAGELGGLVAHGLARRGVARDICLIDETGRVAEGKALDIMQAAPVEGFSARVTGSADVALMGGASVVVVADPAGAPEWQGDAGLARLARIREFSPKSLLVCAGAAQRELIERGVRELHLSRARLIGSAPEALVSGVRAIVAAELRMSPRDVAVGALGVPPDHVVGGRDRRRIRTASPDWRARTAPPGGRPRRFVAAGTVRPRVGGGESHRHDARRIRPHRDVLRRTRRQRRPASASGRAAGPAQSCRSC